MSDELRHLGAVAARALTEHAAGRTALPGEVFRRAFAAGVGTRLPI